MHRRSPCRCTFCSRRPPSRRRPARRRMATCGARAIIGAQKNRRAPVTGARRFARGAGATAGPAGESYCCLTASAVISSFVFILKPYCLP
ncbi:hypothetical protein DF142_12360 [Burkholderia cenocepacia]|nr:hypothetical protein DF142_12360 [Burkholderia cenocepacia]RQU66212.1 hypothetical protein DF140_16320 [Burkholderia cenocepacia]RQV58820.1 hypothetical protein DF020_12990 [Burkholderia cenocepacia]